MPAQEIKILIFGDVHINTRAKSIHQEILQKIDEIRFKNGSQGFSYTFFTGDIDTDDRIFDLISNIGGAAQVKIVKGNMDYSLNRDIPETETIVFNENIKIGLIHGHHIHPRGDKIGLTNYAKKLNVNILISGHTHAHFVELSEDNSVLLLNPGSITASWSFISSNIPSFQIMTIQCDKQIMVTIETFLYIENDFHTDSIKFYNKNNVFFQ